MEVPGTFIVNDLRWLSRLILGFVFLVSGVVKVANRARFQDTLAAMEVLPERLVGGISRTLPALEIALAVLILAGWGLAASGPALLGLLLGFLVVLVVYRLRGGKELACGCFADFGRKTATSAVILRDALLLVAGLPLLVPVGRPAPGRGPVEWFLAMTVVLGVFAAWILVSRLVEAVALIRSEIQS